MTTNSNSLTKWPQTLPSLWNSPRRTNCDSRLNYCCVKAKNVFKPSPGFLPLGSFVPTQMALLPMLTRNGAISPGYLLIRRWEMDGLTLFIQMIKKI